MSKHRTVTVEIVGEPCEIDQGILPVVRWMNSLSGIQTHYSCEGDPIPYVVFTEAGDGAEATARVFRAFQAFCASGLPYSGYRLEITLTAWHPRPRYGVYWENRGHLDAFIAHLEGTCSTRANS